MLSENHSTTNIINIVSYQAGCPVASTVRMVEEEEESIKQMEKRKRQGPAGRCLTVPAGTSCFDSKKLSKVAQNDRELVAGTSNQSALQTQ
jgi:hypothetical protein